MRAASDAPLQEHVSRRSLNRHSLTVVECGGDIGEMSARCLFKSMCRVCPSIGTLTLVTWRGIRRREARCLRCLFTLHSLLPILRTYATQAI
jgi:hypothetical protein